MESLQTKKIVETMFRSEDGNPFCLTDGQVAIFDLIWKKQRPRACVITPTRYGKTSVLAMAALLRAATLGERWCIVSSSFRKSRIMMGYILRHCLENPYFRNKLELDKNETLDRLQSERSKTRLTFRTAKKGAKGEIFLLSAEGHKIVGRGEGLIGHGAPHIILDESALIDDETYAQVKRMLGDDPAGGTLVEVSNPWRRNHFFRAWNDSAYHKIFIDWQQAVREGRFAKSYIDEMSKESLFSILYRCEFPDEDAIDEEGWSRLLTHDDVNRAKRSDIDGFGTPRIGVDVAHGGNCWNVWTLRYQNIAFILRKDKEKNLMSVVGRTLELAETYNVLLPHVTVDGTGIGAGVVDRCHEQKINVSAFIGGEKAQDEGKFFNRRAEAYWRLREWILAGGNLSDDSDFDELADIYYKVHSDKRIVIMSKENMAKRGIESPDIADSLSQSFSIVSAERPTVRMTSEAKELLEYRRTQKKRATILEKI